MNPETGHFRLLETFMGHFRGKFVFEVRDVYPLPLNAHLEHLLSYNTEHMSNAVHRFSIKLGDFQLGKFEIN